MAKESEIVNPVTEADGSNVEPAVHKREREASEGTLLDEEAKKQKTGTPSRGGDAEGKETGRDSSAAAVSGESKRNCCAKDKQSVVLVEQDRAFEIEAGAAEDKGSRHSMEDAWVVLPNGSLDTPGKLRCSHFAIYDGHGGRLAAEYAQKHLHRNVLAAGLPLGCESYQKGHT
uniref:PPM-type phosphatase domain-containing protein n=1 Tax=Rhizophora mucronata TaxID=61149 RepID=A0A2P2LKA9_RHIMU